MIWSLRSRRPIRLALAHALAAALLLVNSAVAQDEQTAAAPADAATRPAAPDVAEVEFVRLIRAGRPDDAERLLRAAIADEDTVTRRLLLARLYEGRGRIEEAVREADRAVGMAPRDPRVRLARIALLAKGPPDAVARAGWEAQKLYRDEPDNLPVALGLAELLAKFGRRDDQIQVLREAVRRFPDEALPRRALLQALRTGPKPDFDAAAAVVREARDAAAARPGGPGMADAVWPREEALLRLARRDVPGAAEAMREAIRLDPDNAEYKRELIDVLLQGRDMAAVVREGERLRAGGLDAWWLHHQLALAHMKKPEPDRDAALASFDRALARADADRDPAVAEFVLRGLAGAVGHDEAIARARDRLRTDAAGGPGARLVLASLLREAGEWREARELIDALLADPANREPARRRAVLQSATGVLHNGPERDLPRAAELYAELLTLAPGELLVLNNYAYLLANDLRPPRPQEAKRLSAAAYARVRPGHPNYRAIADTHGWALVQCGGDDLPRGIAVLEELVRHEPDLPDAHFHLGEAYLRLTPPDREKARGSLRRAMELIGGQPFEEVDQELKELLLQSIRRAGRE